ncbi:proline-rich protein HaeIII subfamily 1-like [Falco naumanni]|uniref:proline-rich protein HaeIII subfamily 1-like n=1 Tax=Falco naumanni TaxID=148594 RepID=UPI001ADE0130|nr:proline-rich protein HaeIII subfamily 1-like [Falco naumanni]
MHFCKTSTVLRQERGRIRPTTPNNRVSLPSRKTGRAAEFFVTPSPPWNCTKENTNNGLKRKGRKGPAAPWARSPRPSGAPGAQDHRPPGPDSSAGGRPAGPCGTPAPQQPRARPPSAPTGPPRTHRPAAGPGSPAPTGPRTHPPRPPSPTGPP